MQVRCIVRDDSGAVIHDRTGNYKKQHFRNWIGRTACWALNNGCGVITYPLDQPATVPEAMRDVGN